MILINLLPHREDKRKRRKTAFFMGLGVSAVAGLAIAGVWYLVVEQMISAQEQRNQYVRAEITKLDAQIKDIASLRSEIESLRARQKAVETCRRTVTCPSICSATSCARRPKVSISQRFARPIA